MNKRIKKKHKKQYNKYLCERYPFLRIRNVWTGRLLDNNYNWTELDNMSEGWRKKFGEQLCEELRVELLKFDYLDKFRIIEVKEKFGTLRFYCGSYPEESHVFEIINKYETLSAHICEFCGAPAETSSMGGWYYTLCDVCANKLRY